MAVAWLNLAFRPSVSLLYAVIGQIRPLLMHRLAYAYLVFFFSNSLLGMFFLVTNLFKIDDPKGQIGAMLVSLAFVLGFWGQYILDLNAWSQISSLAILMVALSLLLNPCETFKKSNLSLAGIMLAAALYLYPENFFFHAVALIACLLVAKLMKTSTGNETFISLALLIGFLPQLALSRRDRWTFYRPVEVWINAASPMVDLF